MSARPLSDDEYTRMVEFLTVAGRLRDRLLLVRNCGTGYRITELLPLTVGQVARRNVKGGAIPTASGRLMLILSRSEQTA